MPSSLRILWLKSGPLFPLNTGGRKRTHAMLTEINRVHEVTWLAGLPHGQVLDDREHSSPYAKEKHWIRTRETRKGGFGYFLEVSKNLVSPYPYVLDRYRDPATRQRLKDFDASGAFDMIVCDFLTPAVHFEGWNPQTPTVLFQHNIESQIWKRLADEKTHLLSRAYFLSQYRRMWRMEKALSERFHGVITVSPEDAAFCRNEYSLTNVLGAVPTGVDTDYFQPPAQRRPVPGLIGFLGSMDWMPNVECVQYFARQIFPSVLSRHPQARFRIIGRDPTPAVRKLASEQSAIEVTGTVVDVRPHLDACELIVVPLRSGGGTRIKIFEAMAQGVPVVSTSVGAEGLPVTHERDILLADDLIDFRNAVNRLLESEALANRLAENARQKLIAEHGWKSIADRFVELCRLVNPTEN